MGDVAYRYLEDIAIADVAFEAWGESREALFRAAADATLNVMVGDLGSVEQKVNRPVRIDPDNLDLLLFNYLQEIVFYKDAEQLLIRPATLDLQCDGEVCSATGTWSGEELDPERHELIVDVKAVTLHRFHVGSSERGWEAFVILDI